MHKRLGHDGDLAEVEGISRGIPLLVAALCDQIQAEGHVGPYRGPPAQDQALHAIERTIVQRWWRSAAQRSGTIPGQSSLRDRQRIRALALLLRPDEELVCELWGTMRDECRTAMDIIADRYSCMFAGCSRYDMSDVVRDLVREETLTRTRHSLEWQPIEVGLTRGLALAQRRAAQELSKLKAIDECYASSRWCEAVLDQLNFLLWLGQSDAAQRLLLKHWIAARFAGAAFDDWLLAHAAVLAPKTPDWLRLVHALQIQDYHALDRFSSLLDSRDRAILCYMQSRRSQVDVVTNTMAEQCDTYIELLRQGHSADPAWAPVQDALFDALSSRGHYLLYEKRDYYAAQKDFDEMLKLRPGDLVALRRRGTARQALGDPHGAHDDFSQVLTKNGADAAARYGRGELRRTLRDLPGALDDFNAALDLYPDDPVVRNARGRVSYAHGKLPEALADFDAALGRRQDDPDMWIDRARVRKALGNTKEALDDLTAAINLRNDDPIAFGLRGAYRPANDPVALLDLDKSLDLLPDQPDMHYHRGQVHMARGDTARAMDDLNRSIELRDDPDARYARGQLWESKAQPPASAVDRTRARQAALDDYTAALDLRPRHAPSLTRRGIILLQLGQPQRALADLNAALDGRLDVVEALNARARVWRRLGRPEKALADLRQSLHVDPNQPDALHGRGRVYADQGQLDDALTDFTASLRHRRDHAPTLYQRGKVYFQRKKLSEAAQDMTDALKPDPTNVPVLYQRGCIRLADGKPGLARQDFNAVLKQDRKHLDALQKRGMAKLRMFDIGGLWDLSKSTWGKSMRWMSQWR